MRTEGIFVKRYTEERNQSITKEPEEQKVDIKGLQDVPLPILTPLNFPMRISTDNVPNLTEEATDTS